MFTALQNSIETAQDGAKLEKAVEMIKVCMANGSINDFEADLLRQQMAAKKAQITGEPPATAAEAAGDIKVEGIPF
jgi:hypothetical protein